MSRRTAALARVIGALLVLVSSCGAAYVIEKLYTGRGGATPIRAAIYEQPLVALLGLAGVVAGAWIALQPVRSVASRARLYPRWIWPETSEMASWHITRFCEQTNTVLRGSRRVN